jgi:hypothetical protein
MVVLYFNVAFEFEFKPFQINIIGSKENRKEKGNRKKAIGLPLLLSRSVSHLLPFSLSRVASLWPTAAAAHCKVQIG